MHISTFEEIRTHKSGQWGMIILCFFLFLSLLSFFSRHQAVTQTEKVLQNPSSHHLLGTNDVGQDIFARLLQGTRISLIVAIATAIFTILFGLLLGVSAGLAGGLYEVIIMRIIDTFLVIPAFLLLILISAFIRPNILALIIIISLLRWPACARVIRAQTKSLQEKIHVLASASFGASKRHIVMRHILPDLAPLMVVFFIQYGRTAIFMEAGLAFIGIIDPLTISWGTILHHAFRFYYLEVWWWLFPPGILLSLLILSFTLLGISLERIIDPKLRHA